MHCRLMCLDLVLCGDRKGQSERLGSGSWAHPTFVPSPDLRCLPVLRNPVLQVSTVSDHNDQDGAWQRAQ